ncbi:MAG: helix-turn-helix transcriptional regulator [Desulfovibrio sp.]|nr:helix-turn-helix transcriptional regulator [Desulfovibrio sp.]MBI4958717.1 helix-turn-helix transcriptional regulator [Desulfovibrio sp.]
MPEKGYTAPFRSSPIPDKLPRPVHARPESLAGGCWAKPHSHGWAQFTYASRGILEVRTRLGSHMVPPRRAIWIPPGIEHSMLSTGPALMRSLYIDAEAAPWIATAPCRVLEVTPLARELVLAMSGLPPDYALDGPPARLVSVLLDQLESLAEAQLTLPFPADTQLAGICAALREQPDAQSTLEELANAAGMTAGTLNERFERETGLAFLEWRSRLRLLASLSGLERGDSLSAVALDAGYDSLSAYVSAFKNHLGRTPEEFVPA